MSMRDRIDPDSRVPLEELLKVFPGGFNAISNIVERRSTPESLLQTMVADLPPNENVVIEDREIPGPEDSPPVGGKSIVQKLPPACCREFSSFMVVG